MGVIRWLIGLLTGGRGAASGAEREAAGGGAVGDGVERGPWRRVRLEKLRFRTGGERDRIGEAFAAEMPYRFARRALRFPLFGRKGKGFYDLSGDLDRGRLARWDLPVLATPDDVADWLGMPVGKVAWLAGRFSNRTRPESIRQSHYVLHWKKKRSGGGRLIESPKPRLREAQTRILREILDRVPAHAAAHGFVKGRSIRTNAAPHCGRAVVVKWDLANFYTSVRFNRVAAVFRSLGYSREAALWLARLTTSALPAERPADLRDVDDRELRIYAGRHLPQGAPTSPAIANLSAYGLDVRLSGLAAAFGGAYTRYADDITISGDEGFARRLRNLIPLVEAVIRSERFRVRKEKRRVIRRGRRQVVAGVVVNEKPNVRRDEFDRLKAILTNAARRGAESQNRDGHADFAAHLRGRIAHVAMLNPARGAKLARLYDRIEFR